MECKNIKCLKGIHFQREMGTSTLKYNLFGRHSQETRSSN